MRKEVAENAGTTAIAVFSLLLTSHSVLTAEKELPGKETIVERSQASSCPLGLRGGTLGTGAYGPTAAEKAFFERLAPEERVTGSLFEDYSITGKSGTYVGWFGIVRRVEEDRAAGETKLLVEMKYYDSLTDTHQMVVSFNGAGDFTAQLSRPDSGIPMLSLVKVYGTVLREVDSVPEVQAEYVRNWDWGAFAFMSYGKQKGSSEWKKRAKFGGNRVYTACPTAKYYEERLGTRESQQ